MTATPEEVRQAKMCRIGYITEELVKSKDNEHLSLLHECAAQIWRDHLPVDQQVEVLTKLVTSRRLVHG